MVSSHSEKHSLHNGAYSVRRRPSGKKKEGTLDTKDRKNPKEHPDTTLLIMVHVIKAGKEVRGYTGGTDGKACSRERVVTMSSDLKYSVPNEGSLRFRK